MAPTASGLRHDPVLIALHWLTAGLVAALWLIGQTIDFVPNGALRIDYRSLHMVCGVSVALVLVVRLLFRATRGGMLPPLDHGLARLAARVVHGLLYAMLAATIGLGITNAWVRGDSVFNLVQLASFAPGDKALRSAIGDYHALFANGLLILAGAHAAAALLHHFVLHDATLRRMLPERLVSDLRPGPRRG